MPASYVKNSRNPDRPIVAERRRKVKALLCRSRSPRRSGFLARFPWLVSLFFLLAGAPGLAQSQPVNVVFIMTDDQGSWAAGCYGNPEIQTPHLDALAAGGARLRNAFVTTPVCSPSRATFLTGRIASQHGIHEWIRDENTGPGARQLIAGEVALSEILARNGYRAGISGKWHLGDSLHPQKDFLFWSVMPRGADRYNNAQMIRDGKIEEVPGYITEVITERALEFLQANRKELFFLMVNYNAPHGPWEGHPERYVSPYRSSPFRSIPREGIHPWAQKGTARFIGDREALAQYFASITAVDENVGKITAALQQYGLSKRTLVIFASDHGFMVGHHGLWGKGNASQPKNLYDDSLRIPLIFHHPGKVPAGHLVDNAVSAYDFMPTLLDYLGIEFEGNNLPGRSYAAALQGESLTWDDTVYGEYGLARMIRTPDWKYVRRYPNGPDELYDLAMDPGERKNLAEETSLLRRIQSLGNRLEEWFARYAVPENDPVRNGRDPTIQYERVHPYRYPGPYANQP